MKRSEINRAIELARSRLEEFRFSLPPFAHWTPKEWSARRAGCPRVAENGLGWDITDFGSGDFQRVGAVLFTLRNGNWARPEQGTPYAEKVMVMQPGQEIPLHFHWLKTEDIINRGGGVMVLELYNSREDESLDTETPVSVFCDACERTVPAGGVLRLQPGESITLTPGVYHRISAGEDGGVLICGEVSSVNDDASDNRFLVSRPRFAEIEEDALPVHLLCNEYPGQ